MRKQYDNPKLKFYLGDVRDVNSIIDASIIEASYCKIWNLHEPGILNSAKRHDEKRYKAGLPYKQWEPWWMRLILAIIKIFK